MQLEGWHHNSQPGVASLHQVPLCQVQASSMSQISGQSGGGQLDPQQQQLRTWFDAIDTNKSGELDASELQQALRLGNLHFGLTDVVSTTALRLLAGQHNLAVHACTAPGPQTAAQQPCLRCCLRAAA